ncbi:hypothetical protein FF041_20440 [Streptomyces jumonjinensis]|uniref:FMN-dependent dehydrogenase domain-containing protein n=1 Tax=Streptomyces jumonjinensis TaxID=1945 RepID=A0A646KJN2_STRJU|nr:hypothetical protein [Streptomyces jumonjinensis]
MTSTATKVPAPVCLADVRTAARTALRPDVMDFVDGGTGDESALDANHDAFADIALVPRVLTGVAAAGMDTMLLR